LFELIIPLCFKYPNFKYWIFWVQLKDLKKMSPMTEKAASFPWQVCSISVNLKPFGLSTKQMAIPQENSRSSQYSAVSKHVLAGHSGTATFSAGDQRLQRAAVVVASAQVHGRALPKNTPGGLFSFGLHHLHLLHTI
jgi:hypothetical protein